MLCLVQSKEQVEQESGEGICLSEAKSSGHFTKDGLPQSPRAALKLLQQPRPGAKHFNQELLRALRRNRTVLLGIGSLGLRNLFHLLP